ncbi:hypothetical protein [Alteromonas gilva]|uniref:Uncharacterized protein n=1 Tax=Alteromonas gilva TaxID=2987522 RepID=A0ABT5L6F5_9ALTE|nr:hypothetical protein [Alteromonas gilva]MDC8831338.1 hypothetical protein [Alteromonas gilva]
MICSLNKIGFCSGRCRNNVHLECHDLPDLNTRNQTANNMRHLAKWFQSIPNKERRGVVTLMIICSAIMIFALGIEVGEFLGKLFR